MTVDYHAADASAREQVRSLLDRSFFVEASAGTGKTAALVERYVALVLGGRPVESIVAITFTDKAAAELRDRIRLGLEERLEGQADAALEQRLRTALAGLDRAQISTIHAFCQALLRGFAVRIGIDPAFEVEDEVAAERRFEERWRLFLDSLAGDREAVDAIGRVLDLGLTPRYLEEVARALWRRADLAQQLRESPLAAPPGEWPDLQELRRQLQEIDLGGVPEDDYLRRGIAGLADLLEQLIAAPAEDRDPRLVSLLSKPPMLTRGQARNWGGRGRIEAARAAARGVLEALQAALEGLRSAALADVLPLIVRFAHEEMVARGREGRLVFDDLILRVRDVLAGDPGARVLLRERYDALLIDEFQDTDPLQAEIALAFATDPTTGVLEAGRLFLVGDPKQSIYRFRRADMAMYARTGAALRAAGASRLELSLNRRCGKAVIDWVNTVFERLIGPGLQPEVQPPYRPLGGVRETMPAGPGVAWFGGPQDQPSVRIRQTEARFLAAYCRDALRQGWQVIDRETGAARPAAYRDIAVLLPTRVSLQALERALAAEGIPYRVEGGSLVYATQEVRDVINCLTAIDDPSDDVAVVAALRSPAFACSDVEIARHRLSGVRTFNYLSPSIPEPDCPVCEALLALRAFHLSRPSLGLAQLVERFISERRLIEAGLIESGNRNAFRRARFLLEQARAFEGAGPASLQAFIEWLERRADEAVFDYEGAALDDDEDAVRVMTVHAAKGLEFPIVFLAGLGVAPRGQAQTLSHDREDGSIAVSIGPRRSFKLGPAERLLQHEQDHERAERDRLLYVAATRARDHLIVSLFHKEGASDAAAARLIECGAREAARPLPPVDLTAVQPPRPLAGLSPDEPGLTEDEFAAARRQLVSAAATLRFTSATALGRGAPGDEKPEPEDETEPWSRGRAGTHLGRAVHAALQSLPWDADDGAIEAVAHAQAVAEAVPGLAGRAARLIRWALTCEAAARARRARRALREVPFALEIDGVVLEGYVDLVIEDEDGIEIVDWKTDDVPAEAVPERLRHYAQQAGLYVLGLREATGREVRRVTYVFVSAGVEASPGEPSRLAEEALQALRSAAAPP